MRHFLTSFLVLTWLWGNSQNQPAPVDSQDDTSNATVIARLNVPFGTIVKLEVEIYDGDSLKMKEYQETYLLKINSVNDKQQIDTFNYDF